MKGEKIMPFIDSKLTMKVSEEKKESIKKKLGQAVSAIGKTETYLMVGFHDSYDLYLGGKKLYEGAYVSVSLYGQASPKQYNEMTGKICEIFASELGIPGENIYVTYHGLEDWGWNGQNF